MLFNLTSRRHFPSQKTGNGIFCSPKWGPSFRGEIGFDLTALSEPFNDEENCKSSSIDSSFGIGRDDNGLNLLTRQKNDEFTITELEVWRVEELLNNES